MLTGDLPPGTRPQPRPATPDRNHTPGTTFRRAAIVLLAGAMTVALVRALLVQSFVVPTGSMTPTVDAGDRVLVSRLSYRTGDIHRGDVIVFNGAGVFDPETPPARSVLADWGRAVANAFSLPVGSHDYVKRVIGLPGDRVTCCDAHGRITVNGRALDEPYLAPGTAASTIPFDIKVPPGRLWVMGDNRSDSADSRAHLGDPGGGTVPEGKVVGRVLGAYWPFSRFGGLGPSTSTAAATRVTPVGSGVGLAAGAAAASSGAAKDHR